MIFDLVNIYDLPLFLRKLWLYAIYVRIWGIVYLIKDSANKMLCFGILVNI